MVSGWVSHPYTTQGIDPLTPVNMRPIVCPSDAPKQRDGNNCGPNSILFIYIWLIHRRFSSLQDWIVDVANNGQGPCASFSIITYYWVSERWDPNPVVTSQVVDRIRQSGTRGELHYAAIRASDRAQDTQNSTLP